MRMEQLKRRLGLYVIGCQILLMVLAFVFFIIGAFVEETFFITLGVIFPVFASYLAVAVRYFVSGPGVPENEGVEVSREATIVYFGMPTLLTLVMATVIVLRGVGGSLHAADSYTQALALAESAYGGVTGVVLFGLFGKPTEGTG